MEEENGLLLPLSELPQTDTVKEKPRVNCLSEILREIMYERKIEAVDIHKATGIAYSTLSGWLLGTVNCQLADANLLKLARYLNCDLFYLLYGIGSDDPHFKNENETPEQG